MTLDVYRGRKTTTKQQQSIQNVILIYVHVLLVQSVRDISTTDVSKYHVKNRGFYTSVYFIYKVDSSYLEIEGTL